MSASSLFARRSPLRRYGWRVALAALLLFGVWHVITDATRTYREEWLKKADTAELLAAAEASPDDEDLVFFACARNTPGPPSRTLQVYELMRRLVANHPGNGTYRFGLAKAAMFARKPLEAIHQYQEAGRVDSSMAESYFALGRIYVTLGMDDEALAAFDEGGRRGSPGVGTPTRWAEQLVRVGRIADAHRMYERACNDNPTDDPAFAGLARVLMMEGKPADAESWLRRKLNLMRGNYKPQTPTQNLLVEVMLAQPVTPERLTEATGIARQAVQGDRRLIGDVDYAAAHRWLGECLRRQGQLREAEPHGRLALSTDPKNEANAQWLANLLRQEGQPADADRILAVVRQSLADPAPIASLKQHVAADPRNTGARLALARELEQRNRPKEALQQLRAVQRQQPANAEVTRRVQDLMTEILVAEPA